MGLARSHVRDLLARGEDWAGGRSHRTLCDDAGLLAELRQEIADLPSYGYRRACALVSRYARCSSRPSHAALARSRRTRSWSFSVTTAVLHRRQNEGTGTRAGPEAHQHARLQPAEQRHGRELRQNAEVST